MINKELFFVLLITVFACKAQELKPTTVKFIVNYPMPILQDNTVSIYNLTDTLYISKLSNYYVYRLKPKRDLNTNNILPNTSGYFLYQKDSLFGNYFSDINNLNKPLRLSVDSLLSAEAFSKINVDVTNECKLDKTIENKSKKETIEKYYLTYKSEEAMDSAYLYFSNSTSIFYSLSPKLDSLRNKKLYKVRLLFNEKYSQKYQKNVPKREFLFELQESKEPTDSFVLKVLKKYYFDNAQ